MEKVKVIEFKSTGQWQVVDLTALSNITYNCMNDMKFFFREDPLYGFLLEIVKLF